VSEEIIGKALKKNGKRDFVVLATKVNGRMRDDDPNAWSIHRRHIIEQCNASLRRLQTDYIDLYQIHRTSAEIPIDESLRALDDLVRAGKVRYIGTSTATAWQLVESLWAAKELGTNRFVSEQPPYNLLERAIERELIPMAQTYGIAIFPWSPLAGGFLTGKYRRGEVRPEGRLGGANADAYWGNLDYSSAAFDVLETTEAIAKEKGCSISQLALAWCMRQPGITSPIIGPRTVAQLEDHLRSVEVAITDEDRARIDKVVRPDSTILPLYSSVGFADFRPAQHRW
jgi:aryl-alcohol dehydrogenase-like predicted oxidoreductase